jgi:hypothetical protein
MAKEMGHVDQGLASFRAFGDTCQPSTTVKCQTPLALATPDINSFKLGLVFPGSKSLFRIKNS